MNEDVTQEYIARINKVQDYIEGHLSEEFSLQQLSKIAHFSPYHFHRIFSFIVGETLFQYIQRVRIEKAAFLLLANKKMSITDIALKCGFSNQASFAKAFKVYFNKSASTFRKNCHADGDSNMGKVFSEIACYNRTIENEQHYNRVKAYDISYSVDVKVISDMDVAYIRHTGPYKQEATLFEQLFQKLYNWADTKQLMEPTTKWLTFYHDTPDLTEDDKLRISVCMTVPEEVKAEGEIGRMKVLGGQYAVGHFKLYEDQYQEAWNAMCAKWLPQSGYQPDDRLAFEHYIYDQCEHLEQHTVDIYIPIKPL